MNNDAGPKFLSIFRETTETAINIGWIVHDIQEVAANTQSIGSAITELASSIGEIAGTSKVSALQATDLGQVARTSEVEMHRTSECMSSISQRVRSIGERVDQLEGAVAQISSMVDSIEAISRQTNLLALNATIEASRAGEAGRGFSVVAAEVKALSGSTAKTTKDIRQRIKLVAEGAQAIRVSSNESLMAVRDGEAATSRSENEIQRLAEGVTDIAARVETMAQLFAQQEEAANEVSKNTIKIADKANKVRTEIDSSLKAFERAEVASIALAQSIGNGDAADSLLVGQIRTVAWGRSLAAALVGIHKAGPDLEKCPGGDIASWCNAASLMTNSSLEVSRLQGANNKAHESARRMCQAIRYNDWDSAIPAFRETEAAIKDILAACEAIDRRSHLPVDNEAASNNKPNYSFPR